MSYIRKIREKLGHECIFMPGVRAIIINRSNEVLLQFRTDYKCWGLPAGAVEIGETAVNALKREVHEETGLEVISAEPVALYSGSSQQLLYPNGDQVQGFAVSFLVKEWAGTPTPDGIEGTQLRFWPLSNLPKKLLPMHRHTLEDYMHYRGKFILADDRNFDES
ncbi:NUDIX domain-containing protein [Lentisphaerota bacterium ZTH]|nr:NUDIX domain-containing protein [Lentisphaerota bacterium]WET05961.1 NUDIX domain-containing protein [Lentisphaerota bacterium ZTH]